MIKDEIMEEEHKHENEALRTYFSPGCSSRPAQKAMAYCFDVCMTNLENGEANVLHELSNIVPMGDNLVVCER